MIDWPALMERHGPLVWRTVYRLVRHDADAADCFQNTFLTAWQLSKRQAVKSWPAFLTHLATLQALERLRQRARLAQQVTLPAPEVLGDAKAVSPDDSLLRYECGDELRRALAELDPRAASVFCLAYLDDLPHAEIAYLTGLTVSHIGVLLHRAKTRLRQQLMAYQSPVISSSPA